MSMSPISTRSSLQNRENTVCHVSGLRSMMSVTYATREPPTEPRAVPMAIPCSLHQQMSSDMEPMNPIMPILWKTAISSSIAVRNASTCSGGITPLATFSLNILSTRSMNFSSSASFDPYRIGYLMDVSTSKFSTISSKRFVFAIASRYTSSSNAPCLTNISTSSS